MQGLSVLREKMSITGIINEISAILYFHVWQCLTFFHIRFSGPTNFGSDRPVCLSITQDQMSFVVMVVKNFRIDCPVRPWFQYTWMNRRLSL
jgi:hypothetical protein